MRRVPQIDKLNTLGQGSHTPVRDDHGQFTVGNASAIPQRSQEISAGSSGSYRSARQSSGSFHSCASGGGPSQVKKKGSFVPKRHQPVVHPNYLTYSRFENEKRLGARPKTVKTRIKKLFTNLRREGPDLETMSEEREPNPYDRQLPKDEQGYYAVYGKYKGRGIHGPVYWDQYYENFDQIGTQYREAPGTRLQRTFPRVFGFPDKPLSERQLKFLKEKGFKFKELLGKGSFGEVWLVRQRFNAFQTTIDRLLACKILSLRSLQLRSTSLKKSIESITEEADLYSELNHLNIVGRVQITNLYDEESGFPHPIKVLLFMELMEGDLKSLIFNPKRDPDFDRRQQDCGWTDNPEKFTHLWSKQIVSGLKYLHENNISHMDLKPENILYSTHMEGYHRQYVFKLTDFGLSLKFEPNVPSVTNRIRGTRKYMAPEINSGSLYGTSGMFESKKTDIYSLGKIMAYSIASEQFDVKDVIRVILAYNSTDGKQFNISSSFASLVSTMMDLDPSSRADILQVYNDPWIKMPFQDQ